MAELNTVDKSQLDAERNFQYPSAAASGHIEIQLPALPGSPNTVERLLVRDFGFHVVGKIESSMKRPLYMKSGPQQDPAQVFRHYLGAARGAQLMDTAALDRMETLAQDFERAPKQEEFFRKEIRPYLYGLTPRKR